jgi:hypothetical protein
MEDVEKEEAPLIPDSTTLLLHSSSGATYLKEPSNGMNTWIVRVHKDVKTRFPIERRIVSVNNWFGTRIVGYYPATETVYTRPGHNDGSFRLVVAKHPMNHDGLCYVLQQDGVSEYLFRQRVSDSENKSIENLRHMPHDETIDAPEQVVEFHSHTLGRLSFHKRLMTMELTKNGETRIVDFSFGDNGQFVAEGPHDVPELCGRIQSITDFKSDDLENPKVAIGWLYNGEVVQLNKGVVYKM